MTPAPSVAHPALLWKERALQNAVVGLARATGWLVFHDQDSRRNAPGLPDLILVHPQRGRLLFRELKTESGRIRPEQTTWLNALTDAGQDATIWRPRHWVDRTIEQELRA